MTDEEVVYPDAVLEDIKFTAKRVGRHWEITPLGDVDATDELKAELDATGKPIRLVRVITL